MRTTDPKKRGAKPHKHHRTPRLRASFSRSLMEQRDMWEMNYNECSEVRGALESALQEEKAARRALEARYKTLDYEAEWFIGWIAMANLKPSDAVMDVQARKWLAARRAAITTADAAKEEKSDARV